VDGAEPESAKTQTLSLQHQNLKNLDFLTKFVREFPRIHHIDLGHNSISNSEMKKFMKTLEKNQHIQQVNVAGNKIKDKLKKRMHKELEKNKLINGLIDDNRIAFQNKSIAPGTINMKKGAYKDISFLHKLISNEDFAQIQVLDMSDNKLDDNGAQ